MFFRPNINQLNCRREFYILIFSIIESFAQVGRNSVIPEYQNLTGGYVKVTNRNLLVMVVRQKGLVVLFVRYSYSLE